MPVLPIDNKMSIINTQDAGRVRDGQLRHEEGQKQFVQENLQAQDRLEQTVKPTIETEKKGITEEKDEEDKNPPPELPKREKSEDEEKPVPVSDGIRGTKLDILG
ncbi:hypothetical protein ACFL35_17870 [Candidatus Riflebacteria bacterium]